MAPLSAGTDPVYAAADRAGIHTAGQYTPSRLVMPAAVIRSRLPRIGARGPAYELPGSEAGSQCPIGCRRARPPPSAGAAKHADGRDGRVSAAHGRVVGYANRDKLVRTGQNAGCQGAARARIH